MSNKRDLDEALEQLAQGKSPKEIASHLNQDERRMLQMAQMVRGSEVAESPDAAFVERLSTRLQGSQNGGISRRTAVLGGLGAIAAGVAAGIGLDQAVSSSPDASLPYNLVEAGRWVRIFDLSEVPEGTVKNFQTDSLIGYVIHRKGKVEAWSRICTHMGCVLEYRAASKGLICPCHGAIFDVDGKFRRYPHSTQKLPRLPWIQARVRNGGIEVYSA